MKTLTTLALALSLSLTACATDDDYFTGELGGRPSGKPSLDSNDPPNIHGTPSHTESNTVSISDDRDIGAVAARPQFDDGRIEWAEIDGKQTRVHVYDPQLGLDEITTLNEDGTIIDVTLEHDVRDAVETITLK